MSRVGTVGDVLVVDDNVDNVRLLDEILSAHGHRVRVATDGGAALSVIEYRPPEVVLLDIRMPGIDGHAVCERLKADDTLTDIPVIFLSGVQDAGEKVRAFREGAVDYLTKPFEAEELLARVSTHLTLHRLHAELRRQSDHARRASEAKSRFIAAASHDLRQPLDTMRLFIDALNRELSIHTDPDGNLYRRLQPISTKLRNTLGNMEVLFDSILDITRLDADAVVPRCERVDVARLITSLEREVAPLVRDRGLRWRCERGEGELWSDPILLERLLRNLLDNAVKYTRDGTVSLCASASDGEIEIAVADTGEGIAGADRALIFEEFYKIDRGVRGSRRGIGLGLSIVKRLCRLLGCPLHLHSTPGEGTRVSIRLDASMPADGRDFDRDQTDSSGDVGTDVQGEPAARVLLVDDSIEIDGDARTRTLLTAWGHELVSLPSAGTRDEGLGRIDLIVADSRDATRLTHHLERLDACRRSTALSGDIPLITIGPAPESAVLRDRRYAGTILHLDPPIRPARLRSTLRACLRRSRDGEPLAREDQR